MQMFSYYLINIAILPKFFNDDFNQHKNGSKVLMFIYFSPLYFQSFDIVPTQKKHFQV